MAARRKYSDELRERAVRLYRDSDPKPTMRRLAEQLDVHPPKRCGIGSGRPKLMRASGIIGRPQTWSTKTGGCDKKTSS